MGTFISIHQATIQDVEKLAPLFDQYRIFYDQSSDLEGAKRFLFDRFEHQQSIIFAAKEASDQHIVGFTQLYPTFSSISMKRSWILNDLFVTETHRNQGIARALLEEAQRFAVATNAKGIELSTALENKNAQKLYEQFGYERDQAYYHYYLTL